MEYSNHSSSERYSPKVILSLRQTNDSVESYQLISHRTLYIRKTYKKRGGQLLDFNNIHINRSNKLLYDELQDMFMIDEIFNGMNHTFVMTGRQNNGKTHTLLGCQNDEGILLHFINHLFAQANSGYRLNTSVRCSFFEYADGTFWDLLAVEQTRTQLNRQHHYLSNLIEVKIQDVCDFMIYLRTALRTQFSSTYAGKQQTNFMVKISVCSFDEFSNVYYESINHFVEFNVGQIEKWVAGLIRKQAISSTEFQDYVRPFAVGNAKLYVIHCVTDKHYELIEQAQQIETVLQLRNLEVDCFENRRADRDKEYIRQFQDIQSRNSSFQHIFQSKYTNRQLDVVCSNFNSEMRKLFYLIDQAIQHYEEELTDQIREVCEYRLSVNKILEQRYSEESCIINGEEIGLFWREPLSKLHGLGSGEIYLQIRSRRNEFIRDCRERIVNIRNLIRLDYQGKSVCTVLLESIAEIITSWNRLLLEEGRHFLIDRFVRKEFMTAEVNWLRGRLRILKKKCYRVKQDKQNTNSDNRLSAIPLKKASNIQSIHKISTTQINNRSRFLTRADDTKKLPPAQKTQRYYPPNVMIQLRNHLQKLRLPRFRPTNPK